jgi:hypothetical protein
MNERRDSKHPGNDSKSVKKSDEQRNDSIHVTPVPRCRLAPDTSMLDLSL